MTWDIIYLPDVLRKDVPRLDKAVLKRIKEAVDKKLAIDPIIFGKPLQHNLANHMRLRVGRYRIIYEIKAQARQVIIKAIDHRKDVY